MPRAVPVPRDSSLSRYVGQGATYTDCYEVMFPGRADLGEFITAFYTTWLFRLERLVLAAVLRRPIRDAEVAALAAGADSFAVWQVETRGEGQILLCDTRGATRSWLAVAPKEGGVTRLLFGSAVVAHGPDGLPRAVHLFTPLHRVYARGLLRLAEWKLRKG
ncbi:hypothetical protein BOO69_09100 [Sulfitobacter alexandrii]|uniref:DUF2867 domain-containing protein n=1 Tax=Sulfitobacter alexandrii TaxID=1917485 RepID=A0A1J0WLY7_9RHOB|nr:hypothetical protein BOO69_09100 [Sulfitobacter alexandrii]